MTLAAANRHPTRHPARSGAGRSATAHADPAPVRFELIASRAGFEALRDDWNALFDRAGRGAQAFQTFGWNRHWSNHYLDENAGDALAIVTARRADRLVMVWPLVSRRIAGLQHVTWMGEPVSQYGDVLAEAMPDTNALLREAWDFLVEVVEPDLVWLPKLRADAVAAPLMAELGALSVQRRQAPHVQRDAGGAPSTLGSAKNRRGRRKRLARLGTVTFADYSGNGEARAFAERTVEMKRAQLMGRGVLSPALADRRTERFFGDAAMGLGEETGTRVFELLVNNEPAASAIFIDCKDHVIAHITAFDARFEKASVGMLLLEQSIVRAFDAGYRTFDLLPPADAYKTRWAHGTVEVTDWAVATSLKGAMFARLYLALARPALKASLEALPLALRRFVVAFYSA